MADSDGVPPDVDEDLGEPIAELSGYEERPSGGFLGRVVRSLQRRTLGSQLATLTWTAMGEVFLEFLKVIHSLFQSGRPDQGE